MVRLCKELVQKPKRILLLCGRGWISRWDALHVQQDRELERSVIRVEHQSARGTRRDPRVRWFLTLDDLVPLEQIPEH
jgi:hypothetical protein